MSSLTYGLTVWCSYRVSHIACRPCSEAVTLVQQQYLSAASRAEAARAEQAREKISEKNLARQLSRQSSGDPKLNRSDSGYVKNETEKDIVTELRRSPSLMQTMVGMINNRRALEKRREAKEAGKSGRGHGLDGRAGTFYKRYFAVKTPTDDSRYRHLGLTTVL
jgi:hypothetical protein